MRQVWQSQVLDKPQPKSGLHWKKYLLPAFLKQDWLCKPLFVREKSLFKALDTDLVPITFHKLLFPHQIGYDGLHYSHAPLAD